MKNHNVVKLERASTILSDDGKDCLKICILDKSSNDVTPVTS